MTLEGKSCKRCGKWQVLAEFAIHKTTRDRHHPICKACKRQDWYDLKRLVITQYGGVCTCCGEDRLPFLVLDHINNDGAAHRRQIGGKAGHGFYVWARDNYSPDILQVHCANCNTAKIANEVCPHKEEV